MSKIIYICSKNKLAISTKEKLNRICKSLEPDNISCRQSKILVNSNIAYGVMNPENSILTHNNSILIGQLFENKDKEWERSSSGLLDGSFALFRDEKNQFEIVSDPTGSKTIWYYKDEEYFISSTSQRAIVMFLESFEFDRRVIPWMLSTGTLGPTLSWDKRLKKVAVDSSIILDKKKWIILEKSNPIEFKVSKKSDKEHEELLKESLTTTIKSLNLDFSKWRLPLSGGYDSRGILSLLYNNRKKDIKDLKTITWGLESSQYDKRGNAYIAKRVADYFNISNKYYYTDVSKEPIEKVINRFFLLGEGRIENLNGYMDGFFLWKKLYEDGVEGIIRGDEGFGWNRRVSSALQVRYINGCSLCSDFSNLKGYEFETQELPKRVLQKEGESLEVWRDRLVHEYRLPIFSAALSDLKSSYVDIVNPILSKKIVHQIRELPDNLRNRSLFEKIVDSISPKIDFATKNSTASFEKIFSQKNILNLMIEELTSKRAQKIFSKSFLEEVSKKAKEKKIYKIRLKKLIKKCIRVATNKGSKKNPPTTLDAHRLLFRVYLIIRMDAILTQDSNGGDGDK